MQTRSPVIFWLLLAATLSIDAAAATLAIGEPPSGTQYSIVAVHALILSQMSIVCILTAISQLGTFWKIMVTMAAVLAASAISGWLMPLPPDVGKTALFVSQLGYYGLHAVLLLAAVWLIQRTKFWARRAGAIRSWQFSVIQVLVAMTLVAVLSALMRNNLFISGDNAWMTIVIVAVNLILVVASFWLWNLSWHWLLRAAGALAVAGIATGITIGIVMLVSQMRSLQFASLYLSVYGAYFDIQTLVLSAWFAWGQIVPDGTIEAAVAENWHQ